MRYSLHYYWSILIASFTALLSQILGSRHNVLEIPHLGMSSNYSYSNINTTKRKGGWSWRLKCSFAKLLRTFLELLTSLVSNLIASGFLPLHMEFFENMIFEFRWLGSVLREKSGQRGAVRKPSISQGPSLHCRQPLVGGTPCVMWVPLCSIL